MSLTQRTFRITLAALFSIVLANYMGLENAMSAGIIAILSILDTRLETLKTALARLLSTILAFIIASVVFSVVGFSIYSFGIYLAIYIPLAYLGKVDAGLAPCSVLVTHFILAESISWHWQLNGFLLMLIGLSFALLFSLWIPSYNKKLDEQVKEIESQMSLVLFSLESYLMDGSKSIEQITEELNDLNHKIMSLDHLALIEYENKTFSRSVQNYYIKYAQMRKQQYQNLERMSEFLPYILLDTKESHLLASIFGETAEQLDETNTGVGLLQSIEELYQIFRESELPKSRKEFESRAILYYFLTDFEKFLFLKHDFYVEYSKINERQ